MADVDAHRRHPGPEKLLLAGRSAGTRLATACAAAHSDQVAAKAYSSVPVLVVAGVQDCATGVRPVVAVAQLFPAGRAVVLESCAHFPWLGQPIAFRTAVASFLSPQRGSRGRSG